MKIAGLAVVGHGEADRYLARTLDTFARLCDDVVIAGNCTDKKTERLIKDYGFWFYRDDREWGRLQYAIKTDLLKKIGRLKPDWVLPLDADEILIPSLTRETLESLTKNAIGCYFYIVNHWNDEAHYMQGLSFWNIRFFAYLPDRGLAYAKRPLHCGLAPPYAYYEGRYVPHIVRHFGLMKKSDRMAKVERYAKYDPEAKWKGKAYYDALKADGEGSEYHEEEIMQKVEEEVKKIYPE